MKCPKCVREGRRSNFFFSTYVTSSGWTTQQYYDPDGVLHHHDESHEERAYRCGHGHQFLQSIPHSCVCGWKQEVDESLRPLPVSGGPPPRSV